VTESNQQLRGDGTLPAVASERAHDFARRQKFPGTDGNLFDVLVHIGVIVEQFPNFVFATLLFMLALTATLATLPLTLALFLFFIGDWMLLSALPRATKSFGPAKPPTLLLAILRMIPAVAVFALVRLGTISEPLAGLIVVQLIGTALVIYSFWIEPHRIGVTHQTLRSPKLKSAQPLRVLHVGDLHIERITNRERQLLELVRDTSPDVILFSGDFLNLSNVHDPVAWEDCSSILRELSAPLGVYAVTGSPPVDPPNVVAKLLDGLPIRWLRDDKVTLDWHGDTIDVIGITCTHKPFLDAPRLHSTLNGNSRHFKILIYHTPDLAPEASDAGIDLQLSGHTHGGQVRLPYFGALYTSSLYGKRFESGRRAVGNLTLYVTRGIGLEGKGAPRVRFLCPPEIILWEIVGETEVAAPM
jgi:predicted MPP superfamily phosphohydrolase